MVWEFLEITIGNPPLVPPEPGAPGGEGGGMPDGSPSGENNMLTVGRLIAASNSKIWYESVTIRL